MKKQLAIWIWILVYAALAVGIVWVIYIGGNYPVGSDTMCHVYKGSVLLDQIKHGNWYPLYDRYWYNGVQMMRYWAPLPVYFLAMCQALAGGVDLNGYLMFVGLVFYLGALSWLYIGVKKERMALGGFFGILWFFMPNNLMALFVEGNLPRTLSMVLLPLFFYCVYEYLFEDHWKTLYGLIPVFTGIVLCHTGYAGMIVLAMLVFLLVFRIATKEKGKCLPVILAMVLPFAIIGIWMFPSLKGGITNTDSSQVMVGFFQSAWKSLDPLRRLREGCVDFYFGLAAFLIAVFGMLFGKKKESVGFVTAVVIFACTTNSLYYVLVHFPGSQYLWMLRFISIALCMILYSLLIWKTLRKWILAVCIVLLVADVVPSLSLVYQGVGEVTAAERMDQLSDDYLLTEARKITKQRIAVIGVDYMGATGTYLTTDYDHDRVSQTFGAGWQSAATANNIVHLDEAAKYGCYSYLFDRSLAMGDDTLLIRIANLKNQEKDISAVTTAAKALEYELIQQNDGYLLYHRETPTTFGVVSHYTGIGIGTSAVNLAYTDPDIEEGFSNNLNDYSFEELSMYKMVFLSGFTYDNKEKAEKLVNELGDAGVRVVISGDGIPEADKKGTREFLGVTCHPVKFQNGYPLLYCEQGQVDCQLFDRQYKDWQTVYFTGLHRSEGYFFENNLQLDFLGTSENSNVYFMGLNLTYHYSLTQDPEARVLIDLAIKDCLQPLPERTLVPLAITYEKDGIEIKSMEDQVNTTLAYHDIFTSEQGIYQENQLLYVNKGTTKIRFRYAYLKEGAALSLAGVVGTILYGIWIALRYRKKGEEE